MSLPRTSPFGARTTGLTRHWLLDVAVLRLRCHLPRSLSPLQHHEVQLCNTLATLATRIHA